MNVHGFETDGLRGRRRLENGGQLDILFGSHLLLNELNCNYTLADISGKERRSVLL